MKKLFLPIIFLFAIASSDANAQLKNLDKRIEEKLNRKIDQKADRAIDNALNKGEKEIDEEVNEAVKGDKNKKGKESKASKSDDKVAESSNIESTTSVFKAYSKFDFIPGEKVIFYDDFAMDSPGDFPAKWNTNGSGEIVSTDENKKWFELKGNSVYIPLINKSLPENYTLEFDLSSSTLDQKLSSQSYIHIILDDNESFNPGKNLAKVKLPFYQYTAGDIHVENKKAGKEVINNRLVEDIRGKMKNGTHLSIAINKRRFRLWMDEQKVVDIPTFVPENIKNVKFFMQGFNEDFKNYHFYIGNLKIAEGKSDLRSELIKGGKFETNGILFDINSDRIKPESYGILKEIGQTLGDNETVKVRIIGHTDSDGDEKSNLELSGRRAAAVKSSLVKNFGIAENRIETAGKGESEPADTSNTPEGKANNRRVQFVKI